MIKLSNVRNTIQDLYKKESFRIYLSIRLYVKRNCRNNTVYQMLSKKCSYKKV
jgi:hypothetical protein